VASLRRPRDLVLLSISQTRAVMFDILNVSAFRKPLRYWMAKATRSALCPKAAAATSQGHRDWALKEGAADVGTPAVGWGRGRGLGEVFIEGIAYHRLYLF
jgi:hypothetical protein